MIKMGKPNRIGWYWIETERFNGAMWEYMPLLYYKGEFYNSGFPSEGTKCFPGKITRHIRIRAPKGAYWRIV